MSSKYRWSTYYSSPSFGSKSTFQIELWRSIRPQMDPENVNSSCWRGKLLHPLGEKTDAKEPPARLGATSRSAVRDEVTLTAAKQQMVTATSQPPFGFDATARSKARDNNFSETKERTLRSNVTRDTSLIELGACFIAREEQTVTATSLPIGGSKGRGCKYRRVMCDTYRQ